MLTPYSQVENANQLLTFSLAILFGSVLCLAYDCYRTILLYVKAPSFICHFADIIYCLICAIACFCFLLVQCNGEIRIYATCGFAIGFFLLRKFCSKYIRMFVRALTKGISLAFGYVIHPIICSVLWCYKKILPILSKLSKTNELFSKNKEKTLENDNNIDV